MHADPSRKENGQKPLTEQKDPVTPSQDMQKPSKQGGQPAGEKPQGKTGEVAAVAATKKGEAQFYHLYSDDTLQWWPEKGLVIKVSSGSHRRILLSSQRSLECLY